MTASIHFESFLRPASVAIVGASPERSTPRNTVVRILLKHGFEGRIYPVSPTHAEVEGLRPTESGRAARRPMWRW